MFDFYIPIFERIGVKPVTLKDLFPFCKGNHVRRFKKWKRRKE